MDVGQYKQLHEYTNLHHRWVPAGLHIYITCMLYCVLNIKVLCSYYSIKFEYCYIYCLYLVLIQQYWDHKS